MRAALSHSRSPLRPAGLCDHGSRSVAGAGVMSRAVHSSPFGRFLPKLNPRADIKLRRAGFPFLGIALTHTHHGVIPMPNVSACHGNLCAGSSR